MLECGYVAFSEACVRGFSPGTPFPYQVLCVVQVLNLYCVESISFLCVL